ncbi:MAG: tRNA (N6-threonylcarbamoyladenosine(37)-N6)-methyltransferase TrmO [Candidatus Aenigmarchaeota archaeon]|nr:tRNA (N6-threonylcarbamoyladenosine(37)-N6)-methyltransferase TrmO [Candidatus Aenigmarchaeota archaeon]
MSDEIVFRPIGTVRSPYKEPGEAVRQSVSGNERGKIELLPEYTEGLRDIDGFSHIVVVFVFHKSSGASLMAKPPGDGRVHGIFSTRSPHRPNPVGVSVVKLERISGSTLEVRGIDMIDGTPVIDIKPYIPVLYPRDDVRTGWARNRFP